jgi:hypothetical protein
MRTRTVPSRSILPLATISFEVAMVAEEVGKLRPALRGDKRPLMSFPHRAFTGGAGVDETNAYVPSNAVVAVESAWVCAPAAATKLKIPPIASHPMLFVI